MIFMSKKQADEILVRLVTLEAAVKLITDVADTTHTEAARARIAAQGAKDCAESMKKLQEELIATIKKAIEETPALPFAREQAVLGRVSAIRAFLRQQEERSAS